MVESNTELGENLLWRTYIEEAGDLIFTLDAAGKIAYVNRAVCEATGYAAGELLGKNPLEFISPESHSLVETALRKLVTGESVDRVEVEVLSRDRCRIPLEVRGRALYDKGRIVGILMIGRDIAGRKKAEETVRRQKDLLENTLNSMTDAVFVLDYRDPPDAPTILECNQAACTIFGYGRAEILGKTTGLLHVSEETLREFQSLLYTAVREGHLPLHLDEFRMKRKDGTIFLSEHSVIQLLNDKGERIGWVSVVRDITDRKLAEQKIRLQSEITENMFEGVVLTRASDGVIVYANSRFEEMLGYGSGELNGKNIATVNAPTNGKSPEEIAREIQTTLKETGVWSGEIANLRKDGTPIWCRANVSTLESSQYGKIWVDTHEDITERKQAEEASSRLAAIVQSSDDAIIGKTLDGVITSWNQGAEKQYGYSAEEVKGKPISILLPPSRPDELTQILERIKRGEPVQHYETERMRKDGKIIDVALTLSAIRDPTGRIVGASTIARDISERKQMEEEIKSLARFPSENPNPLLRIDRNGILLTANESSKALLEKWSFGVGQAAPKFWYDLVKEALSTDLSKNVDLEFDGRFYSFFVKPNVEAGYVNLYGREITERKKAEEALRASELKYRALFENLPHGVYHSSPDGKLLTANPALVRMLGYDSEADLLAADIARDIYANPEDRSRWMRKLEEEGELRDVELVMKRKDGGQMTVLDSGHVVRDEQGAALYYEGTLTDITERKQMEKELKRYSLNLERLVLERTRKLAESERKYRSLVENIPDFVWTSDREANIVFVGSNVERILGYTPREIYQGGHRFWSQRIHADDIERLERAYRSLFSEDKAFDVEYKFQRKDGEWLWLQDRAAGTYVRNGVLYADGVTSDITERKRLEEELRAARERLEHMIISNPAVIFTARPRPDFSDFDATYMSRSVVSLLGFRPQDLIGRTEMWQTRVHPDDLHRYYEELPLLWKEGEHTFEYRFQHKDGNYLWIREEAKVIRDAAGKPTEVMGYWTDITDERQMDEMRDRFISAVTHELRTPLISISGYLDLVLTGDSGRLSSEVKANLEVVKRNADRLTSLTDDLLDIQRLQSGKLQVNLQPIDLREIIEHATSEIRPFIKAKKQRFNVAVPRRPLPTLGDPTRLSQVLMNLLSNASKFTPEGGRIRLTVSDDKLIIVVKVADTGIGLRREDLSRVFEPFAAIKKPVHIKGTGLGLSVTKGLVEAHTGKIWAESPGEGKGATFTFALPKGQVE